ncbi:MAG: type I-U CRISPR-associated helicase/endonuclease Cas3 [Acidobacteria bacterium RIFCSPLOWO2_02_FULL_67_36]|nr:MAG: type I-U CRISPR-associated helicase/endonuclease Cas3 [Acidobacteria bacterium RIFCSPLOWO2_02_FULL_67_36]OFW19032.1 MAG: type I-U CRISPR-associated helicase/endonuclease Cas3 [Acidobacteria bacterium RIFCSPLOWO2_12_FULL_66_21]
MYSWQRRLLTQHLLRGDIPDAVDIPTGLGKTTVMALWLAAFAGGASLPRRLVYVVDRRAVVDQATAEAEGLAAALGNGDSADAIVTTLRTGLGLSNGQTLPVSTLRGQQLDNRLWLANPALPAIVVGTVDMIGSRLLFSGYGVSRRLRPMHAGLLGVDALIVLDEAHLVPPFESLMRQVQALRSARRHQSVPPFRITALSATGRTTSTRTFQLSDEDVRTDARVAARLNAPKRLRLLQEVSPKELPREIALRAWDLAEPNFSVLVFCNSRKAALEVRDLLETRLKDVHGKRAVGVELLVGERRVLERRRLTGSPVFQRFLPRPLAADTVHQPGLPAFLIATSAGEVGVDLDADHMVSDLVPWERMVQRLGRVNRRPEPAQAAMIEVIPVATGGKDEAETAIDADRLQTLRDPFDNPTWPRDAEGYHDASPAKLYQLTHDQRLEGAIHAATTPEPLSPELTAPLIDAWSMTSLHEHSGRPEVQPWLRGWVDEEAQTRLAWRRWFPLRADSDARWRRDDSLASRDLQDFFEEAAPHSSELVEVPTYKAVTLLKKRAAAWSEAERRVDSSWAARPLVYPPVVVTLTSVGDVDELFDIARLTSEKSERLFRELAHRTAIVDARLGGLDDSGMLDAAESAMPLTLDSDESDWPDLARTVGFRIRRTSIASAPEADWRIAYRWRYDLDADAPEAMELRVEVWRGDLPFRGDPAVARFEQELSAHCAAVASEVAATADRLNLEARLGAVLRTAADLHDAGKGRNLWQRAMGAPIDGRTYAKTRSAAMPQLLRIGGETYRHEFGSLRDAICAKSVQNADPALQDLALHLIASHHGSARPVITTVDPDQPPSACATLAQEAALRFARLNRKWGPWELAWLETLLRAADWKASAMPPKGRVE